MATSEHLRHGFVLRLQYYRHLLKTIPTQFKIELSNINEPSCAILANGHIVQIIVGGQVIFVDIYIHITIDMTDYFASFAAMEQLIYLFDLALSFFVDAVVAINYCRYILHLFYK